jgi:hypothetical protein
MAISRVARLFNVAGGRGAGLAVALAAILGYLWRMTLHGAFTVLLALLVAVCGARGSARAFDDADTPVSSDGAEPASGALHEGVAGRVAHADGTPAPGVTIGVRSLDVPSPPIPEIGILTDPDGRYAWPLQPGAYVLWPISDDFEAVPGRADVRAGELSRLDFILKPR